jgi:predicted Zn finger-like uncharacterized protein
MDVTCERCGTEYEFDETLVSDKGTTVKCTNCGHLFKVFRQNGGAASSAEPRKDEPSGKLWQLRTVDGETQQFGSLKELQRLIVEGRVSEDDKLARKGEGWKRLGDIAELMTFFAAARAGHRATVPRVGKSTMLGVGAKSGSTARSDANNEVTRADASQQEVTRADVARTDLARADARGEVGRGDVTVREETPKPGPTPTQRPPMRKPSGTLGPNSMPNRPATPAPAPSVAPPRVRGDQTARGIGQKTDSPSFEAISPPRPQPAPPPPPAPAPVHTPPPPPPPRAAKVEEEDDFAPPPPREREREPATPPPSPSQRPPARGEARPKRNEPADRIEPPRNAVRALHVDDEEEAPRPAPKRGLTGVVVGLATLVLLGGAGAFFWPRFFPAETAVPETPAARFVSEGEAALLRDRVDAYEGAADAFNKALAFDENDVRAQVGLSRAHALTAQAHLFEADDIEARAGTDEALHAEATILRRQVTEEITQARTHAESAVRAGTGGADAEVALADALRLGGERDLSRSRLDRARTLESTPSSETLRVEALWTAGPTGLTSARDFATQAVQATPPLLRSQLLLARVAIASGDQAAAQTAINAVLATDASHPEALRLRDRAALLVAAAPPPEVPVAPVPEAIPTPPEAVAPTPATPTTPGTPTPVAAEGAPAARDYAGLVREGTSRLERGQVAAARQSFEAALRLRPGTAEAMTGLGNVMLNEGNPRGAASQFSAAATNGNGSALIGLGQAYRALGQNSQALEAYRRYLQLLPNGSDANVARRQVEALGGGSGGGSSGGSSSGGGSSGGGSSGGGSSGGSEPSGPSEPANPPPEERTAPPPEETPPPRPEPVGPAIESEP